MNITDFDYALPPELIARYPLPERSASRLLQLTAGKITHGVFTDVLHLLHDNDLLVFNDTRVMPARFFGHKETGGRIEVMVERILAPDTMLCMLRSSKPPKLGSFLLFPNDIRLEVLERRAGALYAVKSHGPHLLLDILETLGEIPLPPYFHRAPDAADKERYQTVYAKHQGSIAAPTAGLHFDHPLLEKIRARGIATAFLTLHVGIGTFAPIRVQDIKDHRMHHEYIHVSPDVCQQIINAKQRGGRVIAVGTTTARALETACLQGSLQPFHGDTNIFIYPGFSFQCIDALITNFHLPSSTLLMLVCALGGHANVLQAYQAAIEQRYRFYSYGDAMWVGREG